MEEFKAEDIVYANARLAPPKKLEPSVDEIVSKIVGKKVYTTDPRLISLIVKWKKQKDADSPDNFLQRPKFIDELKKVFNNQL